MNSQLVLHPSEPPVNPSPKVRHDFPRRSAASQNSPDSAAPLPQRGAWPTPAVPVELVEPVTEDGSVTLTNSDAVTGMLLLLLRAETVIVVLPAVPFGVARASWPSVAERAMGEAAGCDQVYSAGTSPPPALSAVR